MADAIINIAFSAVAATVGFIFAAHGLGTDGCNAEVLVGSAALLAAGINLYDDGVAELFNKIVKRIKKRKE